MEIERLTISNFRGIKGEFVLEPNCDNVVLVGKNGCGKSSVISAIDFMLTGSVQHLTGEGTKGISPKRHGPHVDAEPADAWVEAKVTVDGEDCTVRRQLDDPGELIVESESAEHPRAMDAVFDASDRGLHLLSRKEILDFITARGSTRFDRIQQLLDLNVDSRRETLRKTTNHFEDEANRFKREANKKRADLRATLSLTNETVHERVSDIRASLGGDPLPLASSDFRSGIDRPTKQVRDAPLLRSDCDRIVTELIDWSEEYVDRFLDADNAYRDRWSEIDMDRATVEELERRRLLELGSDAIDPEATACPLCLEPWDPEALERGITDRLERLSDLEETIEELESVRDRVQQQLTDVRVSAESLVEVLQNTDRFDHESVRSFAETIAEWEGAYDRELTEKPPKYDLDDGERREILTPDSLERLLHEIRGHIDSQPALDQLEYRWETLSTAERLYEEMLSSSFDGANHERMADELEIVRQTFLDAKDHVLEQVYEDIEEQFEHYYRAIHEDESDFSMSLGPTKAGVDLDVDFYGRGQFQPHALHSEGHQDSMGICLYFALCDWLNEIEGHSIVMLDDVVMSIDNGHRRPLAKLLASELSEEYQLFITTHDDSWHRHLRSEGVVNAKNAIQFSDWDIENGPQTYDRPEMEWQSIEEHLQDDHVSIAAHQTRLMAEWFLKEICDNLAAKVTFKSSGKWTMGDFKMGAVSRYKDLLDQAKKAERSWDRNLTEIDDAIEHAKDVFERIDVDGAALNPNIHWNETDMQFGDYSGDELRSAVEAYRDLFDIFWCKRCGSSLRLLTQGNREESMSCRCKDTSFNLVKK